LCKEVEAKSVPEVRLVQVHVRHHAGRVGSPWSAKNCLHSEQDSSQSHTWLMMVQIWLSRM
jgi:hypothetical protein